MESVTLYSTHCPRCNVLEKKLTSANINFEYIDDFDVDKLSEESGIQSAPVLKVNDTYMDFSEAVKWVNDNKR